MVHLRNMSIKKSKASLGEREQSRAGLIFLCDVCKTP